MSHNVALSFADGKTLFIAVKTGELLLDAALRQGISLPLDCREGVCGTCQGRCESGNYEQEYVDEEALSETDLVQRKMLACQTRVHSDSAFYFDYDSTRCHGGEPLRLKTKVKEVQVLSANTAILHLDASEETSVLQFLPGQYARLEVPGTDQWRAYSFANRPNPTNQLQFLIRLLPDGAMSNYLRERCVPGTPLDLEAPLGSFYLRQVERPLVMVAGGTGLSAFLGMLDEMAELGGSGHPTLLYYGVNYEADLCELPRLESYRQRVPGFDFIPVVSQPTDNWQGARGFIPDHFDRERLADTPFDMYLCGPPPMVEAVKDWLGANALGSFKIYSEKFLQSANRG